MHIVLNLHLSCAHIGRNKMLQLIYKQFWHPRVNQVVVDIVQCCPVCQTQKNFSANVTPPMLKILASSPFDLCAMDLLQFPKTLKGNKYCLVFIDHYSKCCLLYTS